MKIASGIIASMTGVGVSKFTGRKTKPTADSPGDGVSAAGANALAAGSRIADAVAAREIIEFTKAGIMSRARQSVSGQANQSQRKIINLIQ